jgi:hypothetical protein
MSAQRAEAGYLVVRDRDGDRLEIEPTTEPAEADPFVVNLHAVSVSGTVVTVGLTLEDGLATLSALSDALKVERYVPDAAR